MTRAVVSLTCCVAIAMLAACAAPATTTCSAGERAMVSDRLFFGTQRAAGDVTPADWTQFLAAEVTPRFPAGFTTWSASGQWRAADGRIVREPSYVLEVVHDTDASADAAIGAIATAYKARFQQESVLRVRAGACVAF
jgi:hypothetical protein